MHLVLLFQKRPMQLQYWMQLHKYLEILQLSMRCQCWVKIKLILKWDWEEIRNDSSFYNQSFESYAFQFDETIETNKDGNDSFLANLANLNKH